MLHVDVGHLVRHHPGEFGFVVRGSDGANIYKNRSAGQSECVDLLLRDHMELVGPRIFLRDHRNQFPAQLLHVLRHRTGVRQHRHLFVDLCHGLLPELYLLLLGDT